MKIVLADSHPVFVAGVRAYFDQMLNCGVVASVTSSDTLINALTRRRAISSSPNLRCR